MSGMAVAALAGYELVGAGAFLVAIGVALFGLRARKRRRRRDGERELPAPRGPMVCPACGRESAPGTVFCPSDARRLVHAEGAAAGEEGRRGASRFCPRCRRAFDAQTRFCPFDAEELRQWQPQHGHEHDHESDGELAKICPVCAAKYGVDATFCGRDGSELMIVN